jgi:hypothetical protein
MKNFGSKLLGLCGLMVILAAMLAPAVVLAEEEDFGDCPPVDVNCSGRVRTCGGYKDGRGHCVYSENCMTCGPLTD